MTIFNNIIPILVKVADQFNSMAPAFKDFNYFVCFYASNQSTIRNGWDIAVDSEVEVDNPNKQYFTNILTKQIYIFRSAMNPGGGCLTFWSVSPLTGGSLSV